MLQKQKGIEQVQVQNSNTNGNEMLSTREAELLNSLLEKSRNTFDFQGKKVVFVTGSSGSRILPKVEYFNTCINPWIEEGKIFWAIESNTTPDGKTGSQANGGEVCRKKRKVTKGTLFINIIDNVK